MSEPQASVVLHPISPLGPESSITRSFTLSNSNPIFEIGRSSKREVKNRTPAKDNGWFDSRVMSRDHAELGFNMDNEVSSHYLPFSSFPRRMGYAEPRYSQKMIYIRDFGSTHGTWLNNIKLVTDEATPLLNGDILRFGIDVDRGDEEFPALSVRCGVSWSQPISDLEISPCDPSDMLYNQTADPAPTAPESKQASELRPSSTTNTFCVPDDDESDAGEIKVNQISPFKIGDGDITVIYDESKQDSHPTSHRHELSLNSGLHGSECEEAFPMESSHEDYSESSNGEDSEFDSDPSSFSQVSDSEEEGEPFNYLDFRYPISDDEISGSVDGSDVNSQADFEDDYSVGQDEDEEDCIDPSMLTHEDNVPLPSVDGAVHSFTGAMHNFTTSGVIPKPLFKAEVQEQGPGSVQNQHIFFSSPFPLTPITPVLDHKREEDDGSQRLGRLSIRDMLNNYQDGPFAGPSDSASKDSSLEEDVVAESSSPAPLKRKASEMESQDAQILESIMPPSEKLDLETISQSQVAEAISSALSESPESEPPKKRVKATHDTSNNIASYTATAVISALLGGLGTIAILAALPAEYFQ
ncbi:hypothetical protein PEBR_21047 [Penicillium brasilianum]|uniref:FHA domain-containing protein n=1 Tax=Penicillium brasilianum TaxID=104259 RepID=A0A1S9RNA8_PENBI|nr:hypothetical protein PEBR_21047 [Penicillium brasilianum]